MDAHVVGASDVRFGLYLRPSLAMSRAQVEMHDLVARQYGSMTAGSFMPHATIKGFFRSEATVPELVAALDPALASIAPFEVTNGGVIAFGPRSIVIDVQHDAAGHPNAEMIALHRAVLEVLLPHVHPDCDFTPKEPLGDAFHAHLTLMMGDVPMGLVGEVLAFLQDAGPVGPPTFTADRCHLVAVRSDHWHERWWLSMQWTLLHSWRLGGDVAGGSVPVERPTWNTVS